MKKILLSIFFSITSLLSLIGISNFALNNKSILNNQSNIENQSIETFDTDYISSFYIDSYNDISVTLTINFTQTITDGASIIVDVGNGVSQQTFTQTGNDTSEQITIIGLSPWTLYSFEFTIDSQVQTDVLYFRTLDENTVNATNTLIQESYESVLFSINLTSYMSIYDDNISNLEIEYSYSDDSGINWSTPETALDLNDDINYFDFEVTGLTADTEYLFKFTVNGIDQSTVLTVNTVNQINDSIDYFDLEIYSTSILLTTNFSYVLDSLDTITYTITSGTTVVLTQTMSGNNTDSIIFNSLLYGNLVKGTTYRLTISINGTIQRDSFVFTTPDENIIRDASVIDYGATTNTLLVYYNEQYMDVIESGTTTVYLTNTFTYKNNGGSSQVIGPDLDNTKGNGVYIFEITTTANTLNNISFNINGETQSEVLSFQSAANDNIAEEDVIYQTTINQITESYIDVTMTFAYNIKTLEWKANEEGTSIDVYEFSGTLNSTTSSNTETFRIEAQQGSIKKGTTYEVFFTVNNVEQTNYKFVFTTIDNSIGVVEEINTYAALNNEIQLTMTLNDYLVYEIHSKSFGWNGIDNLVFASDFFEYTTNSINYLSIQESDSFSSYNDQYAVTDDTFEFSILTDSLGNDLTYSTEYTIGFRSNGNSLGTHSQNTTSANQTNPITTNTLVSASFTNPQYNENNDVISFDCVISLNTNIVQDEVKIEYSINGSQWILVDQNDSNIHTETFTINSNIKQNDTNTISFRIEGVEQYVVRTDTNIGNSFVPADESSIWLIIGIVIASVGTILIALMIFSMVRSKKKNRSNKLQKEH